MGEDTERKIVHDLESSKAEQLGSITSVKLPSTDTTGRVSEPEMDQDEGSEADWQKVKDEVLRLLQAELLDTPASHLAYVRNRIKPVLDHDAVES
jgi:hypothetical protein